MANRTVSEACLYLDDDEKFLSLVLCYIMPIVNCFGAVGNAISFSVLQNKRFVAPTYTYLSFLATVQLFTLLSKAVYLPSIINYPQDYSERAVIAYFISPIFNLGQALCSNITVVLTIDRYCYVRWMSSRERDHLWHRRRARVICCIVFVVTTVSNFPRMFAIEPHYGGRCVIFRWNPAIDLWIAVYMVCRFCLQHLATICLLLAFNILLIVFIFVKQRPGFIPRDTLIRERKQRSLTVMLIGTTLVTLVGEIPLALFYPLADRFVLDSFGADMRTKRNCRFLSLSLLTVEYSSNIVVYFLLNTNFRRILLRYTGCSKQPPTSSDHLTITTT